MQIREFMTQPVVTVYEDISLEEVARTMLEHHIGGVPVVNAQGKLSAVSSRCRTSPPKSRFLVLDVSRAQVFGHWLGGELLEQMRYGIGPLTWQFDVGTVGHRTAGVYIVQKRWSSVMQPTFQVADMVGGVIALLLIAIVVLAVTRRLKLPLYGRAGPDRHRLSVGALAVPQTTHNRVSI